MGDSKKRKKSSASSNAAESTDSKRLKHTESKSSRTNSSKKKHSHGGSSKEGFTRSKDSAEKGDVLQWDARLASKENTEVRKKKKTKQHDLEKKLTFLWEKFRQTKGRRLTKKYRSKKVSKALRKAHGNINKLAVKSHACSRILQDCLRFGSQDERVAVFKEIKPHLLTLSTNVYALHLVKACLSLCSQTERAVAFKKLKSHLLTLSVDIDTVDIVDTLLDTANQKQVNWFISSMRGHVSSLLQQRVGSIVVEHVFQLADASKKHQLLSELYSPEPQLFQDLTYGDGESLINIISKVHLQKSSILQHVTSLIQSIFDKGILDHSIVHTVLMEYFNIADKLSIADIIKQLAGPFLLRMIHTKNGSKVAILCIKYGTRKDKKKIIKSMNGIVSKISHDQYSCLVLISMLSHVDDTEQSKLLTKNIIREMQSSLKDFLLDKNRRLLILQLLHPNCESYLSQEDITFLNSSIPSFCSIQNDASEFTNVLEEKIESSDSGKKKPIAWRHELLVDSGLDESLVDICIENLEEILTSHFGKDVIYELFSRTDDILLQSISSKLENLQKEIVTLASKPKVTLWNSALKGKCEIWAEGRSLKLVSAYLESTNSKVRKLASKELRPLVDSGVFKALCDKSNTSGRCNCSRSSS